MIERPREAAIQQPIALLCIATNFIAQTKTWTEAKLITKPNQATAVAVVIETAGLSRGKQDPADASGMPVRRRDVSAVRNVSGIKGWQRIKTKTALFAE